MMSKVESANWKIDEAYDVTAQMFEEHSEIKAIFAANDMMALGTLQYLEESNTSDVMVAAYDALAEAKEAIRQDKLLATIDQQAARVVRRTIACSGPARTPAADAWRYALR